MAIDFISIDVEGHELEVLKGFSLRKYNPRIVLIEDNSNQTNFAVQIHMKSNGYELFNRTGVNDWYVKQCDKELFIPEQASAFQEGREKAYIENLLALHLSRYLVHVPESMKSIPKKLIRWMSNAYFKLRGKPRSSIPPGGGRN